MFVKTNQEKTKQVYISEKNSECKKQAHILMISDGKKIFCGKNISYVKRSNMVTLMMKFIFKFFLFILHKKETSIT